MIAVSSAAKPALALQICKEAEKCVVVMYTLFAIVVHEGCAACTIHTGEVKHRTGWTHRSCDIGVPVSVPAHPAAECEGRCINGQLAACVLLQRQAELAQEGWNGRPQRLLYNVQPSSGLCCKHSMLSLLLTAIHRAPLSSE